MKLFTKIILISICFSFLLESSYAVLPPKFESYKKSFFEHKVYEEDDNGGKYEIKGADYGSFESWDIYAHDKNSIYIIGNVVQKRVKLDSSFENFYGKIIYTKEDKVYYKNKYGDLIEITTKGDNLKVLYTNDYFVGVRSNDKFFNIDENQYGFYNDARRLDVDSGCNIATLEYVDGLYFDGMNVCGYAYPVPKKIIEIVDKKIIKKLDSLSHWEILNLHNLAYEKRSKLYDKTFHSDSAEIIDKYLLVSMEYILQYISCGNWTQKNYIACFALHRRQLYYID